MDNEYEKIYQFENLYQAHRKARRGKRDRSDVIEFELDLANQLCKLQNLLQNKKYFPLPYHEFVIHDPKERSIHALEYRDRIVQHRPSDFI